MFSERGILVSGYTDETNQPFGKLSIPEKFEESRKSIERLHPGHGKELEKPMYVGWGRVPYNEGSWIRAYGPNQNRSGQRPAAGSAPPGVAVSPQTGQARNPTAARTESNPGYDTLIQPDGRIVMAGDHVSHIVAWQEGAALSGLRAVQQVADMAKAASA